MIQEACAQVSIWGRKKESYWQGFLRKYPLRWLASHNSLLWPENSAEFARKNRGSRWEKGKKTVGCHTNETQILYIWFLCHKWKKGKDEKWREINITELAGPLVSFGELRLSTITAQSLPRNPELAKRKTRLFLPLFLFAFNFPHFLLPATNLSLCFSGSHCLFSFLSLSGLFPTVCSPEGIFKAVLIHLQAPARPHLYWGTLSVSLGSEWILPLLWVGIEEDF